MKGFDSRETRGFTVANNKVVVQRSIDQSKLGQAQPKSLWMRKLNNSKNRTEQSKVGLVTKQNTKKIDEQ